MPESIQTSRGESVPTGIAFTATEITFIYSFFCLAPSFDELVRRVKRAPPDSRHCYRDTDRELNFDEKGVFEWRTLTHPERRGLTPAFDFVHRASGGPYNGACDEICCTYWEPGKLEIASGLVNDDFGEDPGTWDLRVLVNDFKILIRFGRNGMGTITFTMSLKTGPDLPEQFPLQWRARQGKLTDQLGPLPFIFAVTTLARAEHEVLQGTPAPRSMLRRANDAPEGSLIPDQFITLHQLFQRVLDNIFLHRVNALLEGTRPIDSLDKKLLGQSMDHSSNNDGGGVNGIEGNTTRLNELYWQAPYVVVAGTLDLDATYLADPSGVAQAWWFHNYDEKELFASDPDYPGRYLMGDRSSKDGTTIRIWRCYKEAVLLLMRLYQWRDILGVDEVLHALSKDNPVDSIEPHWRRVLVLPSLMKRSDFGYLFNDVDLVWDTRFLMLFHERSTLILNTPQTSDSVQLGRGNFRRLFFQSLMRTLEGVRGQVHATIVLNLCLDTIIERVALTPESTENTELVSEIQELRAAFAKILRDPNSMATDGAALNVVRRRAHRLYEIEDHYRKLRSKFDVLSQLFGGQAMIANVTSMRSILRREREAEDREP